MTASVRYFGTVTNTATKVRVSHWTFLTDAEGLPDTTIWSRIADAMQDQVSKHLASSAFACVTGFGMDCEDGVVRMYGPKGTARKGFPTPPPVTFLANSQGPLQTYVITFVHEDDYVPPQEDTDAALPPFIME